jgi:diguanylate cyclase (GGDEF)-like protein/PAS domain S-box-containing protein
VLGFLFAQSRAPALTRSKEPLLNLAAMESQLRILVVDDDEGDRAAFVRFVTRARLPYDYQLVSSVKEAKSALECQSFDVILTDYRLRDGTGLDVLAHGSDAAGILVTGWGDQTIAVQGMKAGAADYLVKDLAHDYLRLLPTTIDVAMKKRRRERESNMLSRALMSIGDAVYVTDTTDRIMFVNRAFCETYGYAEADIVGKDSEVLWKERPLSDGPERTTGGEWTAEVVQRTADDQAIAVSLSRSVVTDETGRAVAVVRTARDMTERNRAETALRLAYEELEKSRAALEEIAARDDLTGLYNRREVNRLLSTEVARCRRHGHSMALLLVDLDNFKLVNDNHGHAVGDEVLRTAARLLRNGIRSEDQAGRYGGEEFILLLPETSPEGALHTAERLRQAIATSTVTTTLSDGTTVSLNASVSIGLAIYPNDGVNEEALIESADKALYEAKRNGRNQTVTFRDYVRQLPGNQRSRSGYEVRARRVATVDEAPVSTVTAARTAPGESKLLA